MSRRVTVLAALLLYNACARDAVAPPNAVLGSFGGRGTELVASADRVRVRFVCGAATYGEPILPDAEGRFALAPVLVPARNGTAALAIKGVITSGQIAFDAVTLSASGEVATSHHVVLLNQEADYSGLACLASGSD
jgi:hypothetical protein